MTITKYWRIFLNTICTADVLSNACRIFFIYENSCWIWPFSKKITVSLEGTYSNITKKVKRIYLSKLQLKYGIIDKAILNGIFRIEYDWIRYISLNITKETN